MKTSIVATWLVTGTLLIGALISGYGSSSFTNLILWIIAINTTNTAFSKFNKKEEKQNSGI